MVRFLAKYRDKVYEDTSNNLELPGYTTYDVYLDTKLKLFTLEYALGFSVKNISDKKSVNIEDSGSSNQKGETYISDVLGYPLSGRSYKASVSVELF